MTLTLPFPPSLNSLFPTIGGHRVRSRSYRAWITEAGLLLMLARPAPIIGRFRARMIFDRPDRRARDIDNLAKAIMDLLVRHRVVEDDSLCRDLQLCWSELAPAKPGGVTVTIEAAP